MRRIPGRFFSRSLKYEKLLIYIFRAILCEMISKRRQGRKEEMERILKEGRENHNEQFEELLKEVIRYIRLYQEKSLDSWVSQTLYID